MNVWVETWHFLMNSGGSEPHILPVIRYSHRFITPGCPLGVAGYLSMERFSTTELVQHDAVSMRRR